MKRIFNLLITFFICIVVLFSSCGETNNKIKIALMLPNLTMKRFLKDQAFFLEEAQKLGCEGIVTDANANEKQQLSQCEELIKQGVKSIVIAAINSNTGGEMVRMAKDNGVHVLAYDGIINNCPLDYLITFDNEKVGTLMAQYAVSKAPYGDYILIGGDKSNLNAIQIRNGEDKVLAPFIKEGKINVAYADYTDTWSTEDANMIIRKYLRLSGGNKPTAVLGSSDNIAGGVIDAFETEGVDLPITTGQDASLESCRSIMMGKQTMTIYKPIKSLAAVAANVAYKLAKGQKIEGVNATTHNGNYETPTIIIDIIAVDKSNMESTVIADGFEKKEDIMKQP